METPPKWLSNGYALLFSLLPWSLDFGFGAPHIMLPSEPLMGFLCFGLLGQFWQKPQVLRSIFSKNIFLSISLAYIAWMAVTACFSSLPLVSWKYWLVETAHWWVFALGISAWPGLWRRAFPWFAFSMAGVAVYTLAHHAQYDFRADQALLAPMPFFPENTMWAAAVAMVLCLGSIPNISGSGAASVTAQDGAGRSCGENGGVNAPYPDGLKAVLPALLLLIALVFSSSRAAWISVLLAAAVGLFLFFGKKGRLFLLLALVGGIFFGGEIVRALRQDVSVQERANRWQCALRMARDRPFVGFGPGTFQFQYLDFQKPEDVTRISSRQPIVERSPHTYGRGGGAHSEYLRALAEMGWLGFLLWSGLVGWALWVGFSRVLELPESCQLSGSWNAAIPLALLTFFVHGAVNDFLHDGRIAALVWGSMAVLFAERQK